MAGMGTRIRVSSCLLFFGALFGATVCSGQITYENHNQIDYGPLPVRQVAGLAHDDNGVVIPNISLGLFTEQAHALIAVVKTSADGKFVFKSVVPGRYRLVAKSEGFCTANVPIVVGDGNRADSIIELHMKVGGIDTCSFGLIIR
jgi:hypothetical protein